MKRNIVQQGPSTLMVSIPYKWVKKYELKKGMEVDVEEKGRNIIISTDKNLQPSKKEISLSTANSYYVWRRLAAAYVAGYDEISVHYSGVEAYNFIEQYVLTTFVGFEITENKKDYCVLKKIASEEIGEFQIIMRRIFLNLIQVSEEFTHVLETGRDAERIFPLERTNNRHAYYLRRLLTKEGYEDKRKTNFASTIVFLLEQLMNEYKYSAWEINKRKSKKIQKSIQEHYKRVHKKLNSLYELYFSYSPESFEKFKNSTVSIDSKTQESLSLLSKDPLIMHYIVSMTEKMNYLAYEIEGLNS
jgi:phosphate uptake regulator